MVGGDIEHDVDAPGIFRLGIFQNSGTTRAQGRNHAIGMGRSKLANVNNPEGCLHYPRIWLSWVHLIQSADPIV